MKPCCVCGVTVDCFHRPVGSDQYAKDFKEADYRKGWNDAIEAAKDMIFIRLRDDNTSVELCGRLERMIK